MNLDVRLVRGARMAARDLLPGGVRLSVVDGTAMVIERVGETTLVCAVKGPGRWTRHKIPFLGPKEWSPRR